MILHQFIAKRPLVSGLQTAMIGAAAASAVYFIAGFFS